MAEYFEKKKSSGYERSDGLLRLQARMIKFANLNKKIMIIILYTFLSCVKRKEEPNANMCKLGHFDSQFMPLFTNIRSIAL